MSYKLTPRDKHHVEEQEELVRELVTAANYIKSFNVDDYVVLHDRYLDDEDEVVEEPVTNSYGSSIKYKVVTVSKQGMPYLRRLGPKGALIGNLIALIDLRSKDPDHENDRLYNTDQYIDKCNEPVFKVDSDYTDAVILSDEDAYDPTAAHRAKSETFKEITKHNKGVKIKTSDVETLFDWLLNLKVGDTFWRSQNNMFTITDIKQIMPNRDWQYDKYKPTVRKRKLRTIPEIVVTDRKGKAAKLWPMDFKHKAVYTQRPRSYKEMKDPIL